MPDQLEQVNAVSLLVGCNILLSRWVSYVDCWCSCNCDLVYGEDCSCRQYLLQRRISGRVSSFPQEDLRIDAFFRHMSRLLVPRGEHRLAEVMKHDYGDVETLDPRKDCVEKDNEVAGVDSGDDDV